MRASEMIAKLTDLIEIYGDRRVLIDGFDVSDVYHYYGQIIVEYDEDE